MSTASLAPGELTSSTGPPPSHVDLVKLVGALAAPESLDELGDAFTGVGRVLSVPMYGFYVLEPGTGRIEHNVGVNVMRRLRCPLRGGDGVRPADRAVGSGTLLAWPRCREA